MRGMGTSRRDFEKKWVKIGHFRENRASRSPYKASEKLESHDTALFAIFYYRGFSELTGAFCLCLRVKNGLKMAKMGIFGAILVFSE